MCTLYIKVQCTLYSIHDIIHATHYTIQCTLHSTQYTKIFKKYIMIFITIQYSLNTLTKTTAAQNEDALSYHRVRGLYFLAVVFVRSICCIICHNFTLSVPKAFDLLKDILCYILVNNNPEFIHNFYEFYFWRSSRYISTSDLRSLYFRRGGYRVLETLALT